MMGLFLGDDAAKNLPAERVFETDGVRCRAHAMAGRAGLRGGACAMGVGGQSAVDLAGVSCLVASVCGRRDKAFR